MSDSGGRPGTHRLRAGMRAGPYQRSVTSQTRHAPQQLTFVFDESQRIDYGTLDGIRVTRAGFDNTFDGVTDVVVKPGYVGVDEDRPNQVVMRFAESCPTTCIASRFLRLTTRRRESRHCEMSRATVPTCRFRVRIGRRLISN